MSFRRDWITKPIFSWARRVLPTMSETEREAIEAGDVWWDADLFTGNPDWAKLLAIPPAKLTDRGAGLPRRAGRRTLRHARRVEDQLGIADLPPEAWEFLKAKKFFAMIIPKEYGGLGFSPYAHSEVVRKISTRSLAAAVTAMVPNSLGPGELLMQFGTKEQQDYWLPRLADGREIPCFGLTSPEAGSDAASMIDTGVVCTGTFEGREVLGIRLNWHKRYITLGPVATRAGPRLQAHDPDHLIGSEEDIGITVALVPTICPASRSAAAICRRCRCSRTARTGATTSSFRSTTSSAAVSRLGKGWKMLMSALAAGRGISLPSLSAAGAAYAAHTTGAYARIREQFACSDRPSSRRSRSARPHRRPPPICSMPRGG